MKLRIILGIVLAVLAFGGGIAGMYYAMPYIAPDRVEATQRQLDSLAQVDDSLQTLADSDSSLVSDSSLLAMDSTAFAGDSLAVLAHSPDSLIAALQDSMTTLHNQLAQREAEATTLRTNMQDMEQAMQAMQSRKEQTVELANTLAKLEDRELEEILGRLNTSVLEQLYFEASGRNRRRLLQAMPAARAASFVGRLVGTGSGSQQPDPAPATLSSSEADPGVPGPTGTN